MSRTNCINCGAAKEVADLQCPFCGTKYADLSMIDFMSEEPIYVQLRSNGKTFTAKAYITSREMSFEPMDSYMLDMQGRLCRMKRGLSVSGKIGFTLYEQVDIE